MHVDGLVDRFRDRGSTPLASTSLIIRDLQDSKGQGKTNNMTVSTLAFAVLGVTIPYPARARLRG